MKTRGVLKVTNIWISITKNLIFLRLYTRDQTTESDADELLQNNQASASTGSQYGMAESLRDMAG